MSNNPIETSVIAEDATITGDVEFIGTMIVEGRLEGDLKGADVIVQRTGNITGTLDVNSINCHGRIQGDIRAKDVTAHSNAILDGKVFTKTLEVVAGAKLNGQLSMIPAKQPAPTINANKKPLPPKKAASAQNNTSAPDKAATKGKGRKLSDLVLD